MAKVKIIYRKTLRSKKRYKNKQNAQKTHKIPTQTQKQGKYKLPLRRRKKKKCKNDDLKNEKVNFFWTLIYVGNFVCPWLWNRSVVRYAHDISASMGYLCPWSPQIDAMPQRRLWSIALVLPFAFGLAPWGWKSRPMALFCVKQPFLCRKLAQEQRILEAHWQVPMATSGKGNLTSKSFTGGNYEWKRQNSSEC